MTCCYINRKHEHKIQGMHFLRRASEVCTGRMNIDARQYSVPRVKNTPGNGHGIMSKIQEWSRKGLI